ncbi:hypothetical protein IUY40_19130 [Flavobacterium sp. ALJ2]|uniref:hypothetical protein n=1 Tax=Flavobacterium sp. ALJ2 TaxID=2786960 RepID=UPI00189EBC03|nr:hypothetical protein [Flavobacterium sp. ALJ2]MBF7093639.1 hypothetical protein [Flavobacterium sp. ALJ2]
MPSNNDNTKRLYEDVKKDYLKLSDVKEFNVKKYTDAWIFAKLGQRYYKAVRTIENIVFSKSKAN